MGDKLGFGIIVAGLCAASACCSFTAGMYATDPIVIDAKMLALCLLGTGLLSAINVLIVVGVTPLCSEESDSDSKSAD